MNALSRIELTKALEDYLKAIYIIQAIEGKKVVRVKDIASLLNVKMSSVTDALRKLSDLGLINYSKRNYVELTPKGENIAVKLYQRWEVIFKFLRDWLGVDEDIAKKDACRIEHVISEKTYNAIRRKLE